MPTKPEVTVIDVGMGNIFSLVSALHYLGSSVVVTQDPSVVETSSVLILPGVGSFPAAASAIRTKRLDSAIEEALSERPARILGICLGMQLLGTASTENGGAMGLGLLDYTVTDLASAKLQGLPIPHIGFNSVSHTADTTLFKNMGESADYYFVHEFCAKPGFSGGNESLCVYGEDFVAAVESGQVFGTQFHPEKSQTNGLRVLDNFLTVY